MEPVYRQKLRSIGSCRREKVFTKLSAETWVEPLQDLAGYDGLLDRAGVVS